MTGSIWMVYADIAYSWSGVDEQYGFFATREAAEARAEELWAEAREKGADVTFEAMEVQPGPGQPVLAPADRTEVMSALGEGFHTAFRKVGDSSASTKAHKAIYSIPDDEWHGILAFVVDGLVYMGYRFMREEKR